jgi:RND family efflux transporter MFP subunit
MKTRNVVMNSVLAAAVVGVGVLGYQSLGSASSTTSTSASTTVKRGIVLSSVSASGNVIVPDQVSLSFGGSGTVTAVNVKVGDVVKASQVLATIDNGSAKVALETAQAQLVSAQAQEATLKAGVTADQRAQDAVQVQQAQISIASAQAALENARVTADQDTVTLQAAIDQAGANLTSATAQLAKDQGSLGEDSAAFSGAQASYDPSASASESTNAMLMRYQHDQDLCQANATTPGYAPPDGVTCSQLGYLLRLAQALQGQQKTVATDQAALTQAQTALTNAQNGQTVGSAKDQSSIASAQRQLTSAQASYQSTLAANRVKEAPATDAALAQQAAAVAQAQAAVDNAQRNLDQTALTAPIDATVTAVNGKVGDQASGGSSAAGSTNSFITLDDLTGLQVKAGFSEADAAKVKVGQDATLTFDALTSVTLSGKVVSVDATQTVVQNVVTYSVYISLDSVPAGLKPGMTASAAVVVDKRENVLLLPSSAVRGTGTTAQVTVKTGATEASRTVQIGLRGDQSVEIVSGLNLGDVVVTRTASTTATGATPRGLGGAGGLGGAVGGGGFGGRGG